jgi:hypothetical protein
MKEGISGLRFYSLERKTGLFQRMTAAFQPPFQAPTVGTSTLRFEPICYNLSASREHKLSPLRSAFVITAPLRSVTLSCNCGAP